MELRMKTLSILLILGCAEVLSASYYQSARDQDNSGYYNSGYQNGQGYQGQGYYQKVDQSSPYQQVQQNPNDWSRSDQKQYTNPNQVNTSNWDNTVSNAVDPNNLKNNDAKDNDAKDVKNTENKYPQDAAATQEDRLLNAKIREKLNSGWFSKGFDAIVLRTSNGIVLITGTVDKMDDVKKVHEQVKNVDGVREVNNQLTVKNK
jgi:osmotically-inducible protein OsmY